jgi:hypothetical protein
MRRAQTLSNESKNAVNSNAELLKFGGANKPRPSSSKIK